jgi:ABC-type multidrug transport system fused ATPase/permease subunit
MFSNLKKLYFLARPYGRRRLALVGLVTIIQGIVATLGVTSIFPFLAIASDTEAARASKYGKWLLRYLPEISDQTLLVIAGCGAAGMLLLANGVHLLTIYITARYTRGFGQWLRVRLLRQIASQEYEYFLKSSSGVLLKKVNSDAPLLITQVLMPIFQLSAGCLNVMMLATALIWLNPWVALSASIGLGGFYLLIFGMLSSHRRRYSEVMKTTSRQANRLVHQFLSAIKPAKVHGVEAEFVEAFSIISAEAARYQARQGVLQVAPKNLVEPCALGILIAIVVVYSYKGETLAEVLPMLGLMAMAAYKLLPNIQTIYAAATTYSSNLHALDEVVEEFQDQEKLSLAAQLPKRSLGRLSFNEQLDLRSVSFRYPSASTNVIDAFDVKIPAFTSLALVGTTGCGKSTLVDLILGLHTPASGNILIDGVELTYSNRRQWMNSIGYVPQDIVLLDDTIAANIALGRKIDEIDWDQMKKCCEAAQVLSFIENDLPAQFHTEVGERGVRLSGGQRQRLGIARALYHKPDLLILDEATSALDNETEAGVMEAIMNLEGKITMIIIAHRLSTIQWCDQVVDLTKNRDEQTALLR